MKIPARRNYHTQFLYYFILNNRQNELCTHLHWPWWWRWRFSCVTSSADRRRWTRPRGKGRCWRRWRTKAPPGSLAASCPRSPSSLTQRSAGRPMGPFPLACKPLRSSYCTASGRAHLGLCRRYIRKEMSEKWLQIFTVGEPNDLFVMLKCHVKTHWQTLCIFLHSLIHACLSHCAKSFQK